MTASAHLPGSEVAESIDPLLLVDRYDVVMRGPSASDRGSFPLGNGVVGCSVWVTATGVRGYLSRSDALTELDRTVKVCGFEVALGVSSPVGPATVQRLHLRDGVLQIQGENGLAVEVFVDSDHDVVFVTGRYPGVAQTTARLSSWRTTPNQALDSSGLYEVEERNTWSAPRGFESFAETADERFAVRSGVGVRHRNGTSILAAVAELHGLGDHVDALPDLLSGRIFGAFLTSSHPTTIDDDVLVGEPSAEFTYLIATRSTQGESPEDWVKGIEEQAVAAGAVAAARERTKRHWNEYWARSWIDVAGDLPQQAGAMPAVLQAVGETPSQLEPLSRVTRAYVITKWMTACTSGGPLPILYNGSLFTLMPGAGKHLGLSNFAEALTAPPSGDPDINFNPDERTWSVEHLWQNLRLPYHSMLARGEADGMLPLFGYYRRFWDVNRLRARLHHGTPFGQWNTEMTLTFGLQSPAVYGTDRGDLPDGYAVNRWGGAIDLSPGLELVHLIFDYYWHTKDAGFLSTELLPYADDLVGFIRHRYPRDDDGRLLIGPINSLETYWDTINPVAVVAGLHALQRNLSRVPSDTVEAFGSLRDLGSLLPHLPTEQYSGRTVIAPAAEYVPERKNVESPELYTVFPFGLHDSISEDVLAATIDKCIEIGGIGRPAVLGEPVGTPSYSGWQYLGPVSALLGDVDRASSILMSNAALSNPGHRFPAMWGPIYDAVPDVDHGANILNTLQRMVLQTRGRTIEVLPTWPRDWDVHFRLFVDASTSIEVDYKAGVIRHLAVFPEHRHHDVHLPNWVSEVSSN